LQKRLSAGRYHYYLFGGESMIAKAELEELYVNRNLTTATIAKRYGVSPQLIYYWIRKYHIPLRRRGKGWKRVEYPYRDEFEEWLKLKYKGSYSSWRNISSTIASIYIRGLLNNPAGFEEYVIKRVKCKYRPHYRRAFNAYHEFLKEGEYEEDNTHIKA